MSMFDLFSGSPIETIVAMSAEHRVASKDTKDTGSASGTVSCFSTNEFGGSNVFRLTDVFCFRDKIVFFDVFSVNRDIKALRAGFAVTETALVLSAQESVASCFRTGFNELFDLCLFGSGCCSWTKTGDSA